MSLNGVGALCKSGGRSRINRFTVAVESRRIFGSCDRNHGWKGFQQENRRNLMILNPGGQNIRGQNLAAAPPPRQISQEEDKIAQVLKIISNLELQKPMNNIDHNVVDVDSSADIDKLVDSEELVGLNKPEGVAAVETKVNVNPENITDSKEVIDAIVEKARNQDVDVNQIVEASSSETVDEELNDVTSISETIEKPESTVMSHTEKSDMSPEDPLRAKVIQSENKKFSMSITSADQHDEDSSSSSSDSDSDSSSSSSDSDEDHEKPATPEATSTGKTQLTKFLTGPVYKSVTAHKPMIKFRKSGNSNKVDVDSKETTISSLTSTQTIENTLDNSMSLSSLEWWQIPDRFKRSTLQDSEISQINSGGADIIFK